MDVNISRREDVKEMVEYHSGWANRILFKICSLLGHKQGYMKVLDLKVNSLFTIFQFYSSKVVCHKHF